MGRLLDRQGASGKIDLGLGSDPKTQIVRARQTIQKVLVSGALVKRAG